MVSFRRSCVRGRSIVGAPGTFHRMSEGARSSRPEPASQGASATSGASQPQITALLSSLSPRPFASSQQTAWSTSIITASVTSSLPSIQDIHRSFQR
jgi:hypothetical protein